MDKWHWKKQSAGERWALVTASDEIVLYSWCDDCGEHGIAGTDEALALVEAAPALLAACEARELVLEHYKHCAACMHNEQCDVGFDLGVNEHGLRQAAIASVKGE